MERSRADSTDSRIASGGIIPGSGGVAAFRVIAPMPSVIPVLISVPHAGRAYPQALLAAMRDSAVAPARLEDRLVDRLALAVGKETGAGLLVADAPRAMIDLNRAPHDIDWGMISDGANSARTASAVPGGRARGGLGLVPRRVPGVGELWKAPLAHAELIARIEGVHQPYHACLSEHLARLRARWGAALMIDLHSMPPLPLRHGSAAGPARVVLGDRFGASCGGSLVATAFSCLAEARMVAAHNRPYAGGYGLDRHGAPRRGIHAMQIEIDRGCYLESRLMEPGDGFDAMVTLLVGLVRRLAGQVAMLGSGAGAGDDAGGWAQAAE